MVNRNVIFLAGGIGKRWRDAGGIDLPKQLVDIHGTPLLVRSAIQFGVHGFSPVVAATDHEFKELGMPILPCGNTIADTIMANLSKITPHCVIACGDVLFSDDAVAQICNSPRGTLLFHGTHTPPEIYAVSLDDSERVKLIMSCLNARETDGRLWSIFNETGEGWSELPGAQDFDFPSQYEQWVAENPAPLQEACP